MSAAVVTGTGVPGWFGKLPGLGDFASRRLPDTFVAAWDRWLPILSGALIWPLIVAAGDTMSRRSR